MLKTYKKWAPFQACHGFVREDDNIRSVIHISMLSCFLSASGFCFLLYPLPSATSFDFTAILLLVQMT